MTLEPLLDIVSSVGPVENWKTTNEAAFEALFGSGSGRYPETARGTISLRAPDGGEPRFSAYIHPNNPASGPYGGTSIAIFPSPSAPCLLTFVVGTAGLSPDDGILARPGHARKIQALCRSLNARHGNGTLVAWSKLDPTRIDQSIPSNIAKQFADYRHVFERYGSELYAIYAPSSDRHRTSEALTAFFDLLFDERGVQPLTAFRAASEELRATWMTELTPALAEDDVVRMLRERRYAIVQGPPGTGKTRLARRLLELQYGGRGMSVQFHPTVTYENFVGGLAPAQSQTDVGLAFSPTAGYLMRAVEHARKDVGRPFLLHIDEINRADLAKVLGEAIYLLEPDGDRDGMGPRSIELPFDFGGSIGRSLSLPDNLHILGTMNTADRSLASIDVAIRRRFAFTTLWPQSRVIEEQSDDLMKRAFRDLLSIFVEYARGEAFDLVPGHSYFLSKAGVDPATQLLTTLAPLLREYISQGYVAGFVQPIAGYLQWIETLSPESHVDP